MLQITLRYHRNKTRFLNKCKQNELHLYIQEIYLHSSKHINKILKL